MLAQRALEAFIEDWNRADNSALRAHLNYPHITHGPGTLIIANTPEEFSQDFDALRRGGWRRSTFDRFAPLQVSETKVNILVDFRRYDANDTVLETSQVFYVMTIQDGKWGMQYRSGGPRAEQFQAIELATAEQEATAALHAFFSSFNAADNEALFASNHVPQAMLNNLNYLYAADRDSPLLNINFNQMRNAEDWDHSVAENIAARHVTPNKVIFEFQFGRFNSKGEIYRTVPALWVLTKKGEKWGVEFRSLMPPSLNL